MNPHIYPFFWQHGEDQKILKEYLDKMQEQGIQAFCIESRPHPEFMEQGWFDTIDFLVTEAKRRGMKIWILDDAKFPTGYANGKVPAHLKKKYIRMHRYDFVSIGQPVDMNMGQPYNFRQAFSNKGLLNNRTKKVILARKDKNNQLIQETLADVTGQIQDQMLHLELEKGYYSLYQIYTTSIGDEAVTKDYLDPMDPDATDILLKEVYEPHHARYKEEFGKTIEAFFSDEPRFGNIKGTNHIIGRSDMPLPFNHLVEEELDQKISSTDWIYLFEGNGEHENLVRATYMDIVSRLYSENFSCRIGKWCNDHGVDYVGHIIEDNNAHARLGYGPGHYFRAMAGQNMAGIDVIGGQIVPGMDFEHDSYATGGSDGEFYHYMLCRLAQSEAKLDPKKQGRAMCEAFGAYGWSEGLKEMKWITDLLVSHGINYIVPHAFSPKEFPDQDCPPHFYARGMNPQYPFFHLWTNYFDRMIRLLSNGTQQAKVGVLYHAFAEWSGKTMLDQKIVKELEHVQVDSNIISEDHLAHCTIRKDQYLINDVPFDVLFVGACEYLPEHIMEKLKEIPNVVFVDGTPKNWKGDAFVVSLEELGKYAKEHNLGIVRSKEDVENLHVLSYQKKEETVYMLFDQSVLEPVQTTLILPSDKEVLAYDAMSDTYEKVAQRGNEVEVHIDPYETRFLVLKKDQPVKEKAEKGQCIQSLNSWSVKAVDYKGKQKEYGQIDFDVLNKDLMDFSGTIEYTCTFQTYGRKQLLVLDDHLEIVKVTLNEKEIATKICPNYEFLIEPAEGENVLKIELINTLGRSQMDPVSNYVPYETAGLTQPVKLYEVK